MTATNTYGRQVVIPLTNKSGGGVIAGDVVVIDTTNNDAFTTSTAGNVTSGVGIAQETIASNATGRVLIAGYAALINVNASVTRGHFGSTYTVAKQATDAGASRTTGTFCQFLTGGTTPDAYVFANPDLGGSGLTNPMSTEGDVIYGGASGTPTRLAVGTAGYGLVSNGTDPVWAEILPWHIWVIPMMSTDDAHVGTWVLTGGDTDNTTYLFMQPNTSGAGTNRAFNSSAAQNDAIAYDLVLAKGTWDCHIWVRKASNAPIITLNQDGSSMGTADCYNASALGARVDITGWTVSTTGKKRMQLLLATKNASSSGYTLGWQAMELRRTA